MLKLLKAEKEDFEKITDFYKFMIENTETMKTYCRWIYGLHPRDELIRGYIDDGAMYYTEKDGEILSAVVLLPFQTKDYREVKWKMNLRDDEVVSVHILCANPKYKRQKIATRTMNEAYSLAKSLGKKAVRLDTLETNIPAQHLYESLGYVKCDTLKWYATNIGWDNFILYEKPME